MNVVMRNMASWYALEMNRLVPFREWERRTYKKEPTEVKKGFREKTGGGEGGSISPQRTRWSCVLSEPSQSKIEDGLLANIYSPIRLIERASFNSFVFIKP